MKTSLRILTLALATLMVLCVLASCGGSQESGYAFKAGSVTLTIGAKASVVDNLGNPIQPVQESGACGGIPGTDRLYIFNGYRIKTTPGHDGDVICMIELTDDSVATPEGLTIGSTKVQVTSAMGTGEASGENLIYKKGNMKLQFLIRDGYVTNIQYLTV